MKHWLPAFSVMLLAVFYFAAPGAAADTVRVHMQTASLESLPYLIANDRGFYRDDGIDFDGEVLNTAVGVRAMLAGEFDATQILGLCRPVSWSENLSR